ncbi:hypothetical protein B0J13DRAFT_562075 [Dactylonectria estremocensis]|uniref:Uncharacterized protein n=1 Tax=Dactylonectria estremocensis TaxID=1079267 RepID=A0A9P9E8H4_9HYPO|nr:hypothetical protein B0J13DRAFT_562075 [Dactylonectria estremocensis]
MLDSIYRLGILYALLSIGTTSYIQWCSSEGKVARRLGIATGHDRGRNGAVESLGAEVQVKWVMFDRVQEQAAPSS